MSTTNHSQIKQTKKRNILFPLPDQTDVLNLTHFHCIVSQTRKQQRTVEKSYCCVILFFAVMASTVELPTNNWELTLCLNSLDTDHDLLQPQNIMHQPICTIY